MATIEEEAVKGRKFRIWDEVNKIWKRVSYWVSASDVEFEDGMNGEDKIETLIPKDSLIFEATDDALYITKLY